MKKLLFNKYTFAILALLIGLGLGYCTKDSAHYPQGTSITTQEQIDSIVYVPKPYPVYYAKQVEVPVPYYIDTSDHSGCSKKKYQASTQLDTNLVLSYNATVYGTLDSIGFSLEDTRPEKVVYSTKTVTETKTTTVNKPKGLYIGASTSFNGIGPSATYLQDKHAFGAHYDLISRRPTITYQFKPF